MYLLLIKKKVPGYGEVHAVLYKSEDLVAVANKLTEFVKHSYRLDDLMIVKEVNFEFKCGVKFEREEEE